MKAVVKVQFLFIDGGLCVSTLLHYQHVRLLLYYQRYKALFFDLENFLYGRGGGIYWNSFS